MPQTPDFEAGFEESMALIDSWGRRAQEQVERAESMRRHVDSLQVSRWSPGREVRVTLASSGLLVDVEFDERAQLRTAAVLSRAVLTALRGAMDDLRSRVSEIAADHDGQDGMAASLVASYDRALSEPLAEYRPGDDDHTDPVRR
jgi:DNA-binding protein YbaB